MEFVTFVIVAAFFSFWFGRISPQQLELYPWLSKFQFWGRLSTSLLLVPFSIRAYFQVYNFLSWLKVYDNLYDWFTAADMIKAESPLTKVTETVSEASVYRWEILFVLTTVVLSVFCMRLMSATLLRVALRMRGFRMESIRDGSTFVKGKPPACQVEILDAGIWNDTFVGCGIRVNNYLVVPRHVIEQVERPIIQGVKSKVLKPKVYIPSEVIGDLAYMYLSIDEWASLGVQAARPSRVDTGTATCTGRMGTSVGYLRKMPQLGVVSYTGSTVPGMSGAAYMTGTQVCGVHAGDGGSDNVGFSIGAILADLAMLVHNESSEDFHADEMITFNRLSSRSMKGADWTRDDLKAAAKSAWGGSSMNTGSDYATHLKTWDDLLNSDRAWASELEGEALKPSQSCLAARALSDSDNILQIMTEMTPEARRTLASTAAAYVAASSEKKIVGQSDAPVEVNLGPTYQDSMFSSLTKRIDTSQNVLINVKDRVEKLEKLMVEVTGDVSALWGKFKEPPVERASPVSRRHIRCGFVKSDGKTCNKMFGSDEAVTVHRATSHGSLQMEPVYKGTTVRPESAFGADVRSPVRQDKQAAFLEKSSLTRKEQGLGTTSKLEVKEESPSPSVVESPSAEQILQQMMQLLSKYCQKTTAGQSLEGRPK